MPVRAISIDVGGVLAIPNGRRMASALADVGVTADPARADLAHHAGTAALDTFGSWGAYYATYALTLGAPPSSVRTSLPALETAFDGPSDRVWNEERADARDGLAALAALELPLVITSNSDGYVAQLIDDQLGLCQVGAGRGAEMVAILDSAVVGSSKPDAGIFLAAAAAAGCDAGDVLHVGDTVSIDMVGAAAVGMMAVHLDPHRMCADPSHHHVHTLARVAGLVRGLGA